MGKKNVSNPVIYYSSAEDRSPNWNLVFSYEFQLILENIIKHLEGSIKDLKNCRLVRKESWERLATRRLQIKNWEERRFLWFTSPKEIQNYCDTYTTFSDDATRSSSVLTSCYRISFSYPYSSATAESDLLAVYRMFQTFPNKVKCLDLGIGEIPLTPQWLNRILISQSSSLAELHILYNETTLSIIPANSSSNEMGDNYSLPQLRYLCLTWDSWSSAPPSIYDASCQLRILDTICSKILPRNPIRICLIGWGTTIPETIAVLGTYHLINSLKFMKIESPRSGDWQKLAQPDLQLETLIMHMKYTLPFPTTSDITHFLHSQARTLKVLSWSSAVFDFPPNMSNLRKIELIICKDSDANGNPEAAAIPHMQNNPILYRQHFPKLNFLKLISLWDYEQPLSDFHSMFLVPQFPCTHLQALRLRNSRINADTINHISEIFTRLEFLDIGQYNGDLSPSPEDDQIFYSALWSASFGATLKELAIVVDLDAGFRVWKSYHLDSVFSGVNGNEIQQKLASGTNTIQEQNYEIGTRSILKFPNLRKLEIFSKFERNASGNRFTDFSAFALFGQLKHLEYLHLDADINEFTEAAKEYLKQKTTAINEYKLSFFEWDNFLASTSRTEKEFEMDWQSFNDHSRSSYNILKEKDRNVFQSEPLDTHIEEW